MKYYVVFKVWPYDSIRWSGFPDKEYFDKWHNATLQRSLEVTEEGITKERAIKISSGELLTMQALGRYLEMTFESTSKSLDSTDSNLEEIDSIIKSLK